MSITRLHHICGISTPGRCSNPEKPEPIKKGLKLWGGLNSEVVVSIFFHCDFHLLPEMIQFDPMWRVYILYGLKQATR